MKYRFVICTMLLSVAGCGLNPPPAPRVPPLPKGPVTPVPKLAADDVPVLQQINAHAAYMKSVATLAATHSDDDLIKGFATQLARDYDKAHASAQKLATTSNLTLLEKPSALEQKRLTTLGRLYGRSFNRTFLYVVTHSYTMGERNRLVQVQKNGSTTDMKNLAGSALDLLDRCRIQGAGLVRR
ncbi:DUF4142 domain-containing protein [Bombella sp. TMW 2.2543]|uniref:DUF4142 domain-containing protein n=1 Tax=Bombella pluederhausensis TaxID=2967336 RepID=A0ABT3WFP1_9PROT|nr:DUF4142 domain-containing protein [Bombella pluederhausensis]MCX5617930.1 DUF4142 domain-containing protein [Bombella pluederhausensis]